MSEDVQFTAPDEVDEETLEKVFIDEELQEERFIERLIDLLLES